MLELKQIVKDYPVANTAVHALKGVDLRFRSNEFVSVLGPSGCGKTTLLNIIGGLDKYTTGDLIIDGVSTKDFKDRDWDTYRNHSIGFVFQTYNLIPHQSVLKNVELALTLAGTPKAERRSRAEEALKKVGLGDHINKRPNQLSGGQMQRVAIARALVNDPDIILADEPTGALDTETGIQIMELLKDMSRDRLIIMVTHNPDLAERYSSRIIRILDGVIVDDSDPLSDEDYAYEKSLERSAAERASAEDVPTAEQSVSASKKHTRGRKKRSSMSFWTAFRLSLNNLFTKKGRTVLTSFAGSIGIIGIALILSVSQGMTNYIDIIEQQTLSSYPLTIESTAMDLGSLVSTMMDNIDEQEEKERQDNTVYNSTLIYDVANIIKSSQGISNDLKSFKEFLDKELADENSALYDAVAGVQYRYDVNMRVFSKTVDNRIEEASVAKKMNDIVPNLLGSNMQSAMGGYMQSMMNFSMNIWQEMLPGSNGNLVNKLYEDQYNISGEWPEKYNEIVLVLNRNMEISDMALVTLGILGDDYLDQLYDDVDGNQKQPSEVNLKSWSFNELKATDCRLILNGNLYKESSVDGNWYDITDEDHADDIALQDLYDNNSIPLRVSGIVWPKEGATTTLLSGSIAYTSALTRYMIEQSETTPAVKAQKENKEVDIFTGKAFPRGNSSKMTVEEKAASFREYYGNLSNEKKKSAYWNIVALDMVEPQIQNAKDAAVEQGITFAEYVADSMSQMQQDVDKSAILVYLQSMTDEQICGVLRRQLLNMMSGFIATQRTQFDQQPEEYQQERLNNALKTTDSKGNIVDKSDETIAVYYDNEQFSSSTYENNMSLLCNVDLNTPIAVDIYASSFDAKEVIADEIDRYNAGVDEEQQIDATDFVAIMMNAVTRIINAVTYVLIAFVAISLIVSSIMIGVITLISVQERTKEIGILRAIGASKRDVSSMFNAETIIIGFAAGLIGVLATYLLCIPINLILHVLTGIGSLNAVLPPLAAVILVAISMVLTLFSGLIPSRSAAKKDPVVALRTE